MNQIAMEGFDKFITSFVATTKAVELQEYKLHKVRRRAVLLL